MSKSKLSLMRRLASLSLDSRFLRGPVSLGLAFIVSVHFYASDRAVEGPTLQPMCSGWMWDSEFDAAGAIIPVRAITYIKIIYQIVDILTAILHASHKMESPIEREAFAWRSTDQPMHFTRRTGQRPLPSLHQSRLTPPNAPT